ncbi:hypothetical protein [Paenibacillus sp. GCM10028914]|uniref:hypothetical protein n=1 Tax=Paenibacillus sp. GCM10028914 TaxID=3273416 RepID=UPI00361449EF
MDTTYNRLIVLENFGNDEVVTITDKTEIEWIISKVNNSPRKDASSIVLEHGPDGTMIFQGDRNTKEVHFFTDSGSVLTDNYIIDANLQFEP